MIIGHDSALMAVMMKAKGRYQGHSMSIERLLLRLLVELALLLPLLFFNFSCLKLSK
jgi:hypothetical protein